MGRFIDKFKIIFLVSLIFFSASISAEATIFNWRVYKKDNLQVFYPKGYEYQAQEVFYYLYTNYSKIMNLAGNENEPEIKVVIEDRGFRRGGFADPFRYRVNIFTSNPSTFSSFAPSHESWFRVLGIHEFTHLSQLTHSSSLASPISSLLGNAFSPNTNSPWLMIEGIATYGESSLNSLEGALNDGYYSSIIASQVEADNLPSIGEATYRHYNNRHPFNHWYIYGGSFFDFLAKKYGEDKIGNFFNEYSSYYWAPGIGNVFPAIGIDRAAEKIYGKSYSKLFAEWRKYAQEKYEGWVMPGKKVIKAKGGDINALTKSGNKIYLLQDRYLDYRPGRVKEILLIEYDLEKNKKRVVKTFDYGMYKSSLQAHSSKLYYSQLTSLKGYPNVTNSGVGTINQLWTYDLNTNRTQQIMKDEFRDFAVIEEDKIVYVKERKDQFGTELWKYEEQEKKKIGELGELISEIKVYKGNLVIVSKKQVGTWNINYLNLQTMELTPIVNTSATLKRIELQGNEIYFNANYGKKYSLYSYNLKTEKLKRLTFEGYVKHGVSWKDQLYFVGLSTEGEGLYKTVLKPEEYSLPEAKETDPVEFHKLEVKNKSAYKENFNSLLQPYLTSLPYFYPAGKKHLELGGQDKIGMVDYRLRYADLERPEFKLDSKLLMPLTMSASSRRSNGERQTSFDLFYPVYQSFDYGLSDFTIDYQTSGEGWKVERGNLNINTEFSFKDPGFAGLKLDYNNIHNFDQNEDEINSSDLLTEAKFSFWEQGFNSMGISYGTDFDEKPRYGINFDFLAGRHKLNLSFQKEIKLIDQNPELYYEYLGDTNEIRITSGYFNYDADYWKQGKELYGKLKHTYFGNLRKEKLENSLKISKRIGLDSEIGEKGYQLGYNAQYMILRTNYKLNLSGYIDYSKINLYQEDKEFISYNLRPSLKYKLAEVRKGLWNPNIFLSDIYGASFINWGENFYIKGEEKKDKDFLFGSELQAGVGFGMHWRMVPTIGVEVSKAKREIYFNIEFSGLKDMNI